MKAIKALIAVLSIVPVLAIASPVFADSPGQLEGGTITYVVKNLTQANGYSNTTPANACDEVQYSIRLHNTSFGGLTNVHVKVDLPSASATANTSTMTATTNLGGISGASSTATVNLSSAQTVTYENGSTTLYNENGTVIKTLPDTITTSGVDIGALNGSTTEFVNYKAKVSCPSKPTPTPTPITPVTTPKALPNTGAGDVLGIFAGATAAGSAAHMAITARRNRR
jgi:hypothetical protein